MQPISYKRKVKKNNFSQKNINFQLNIALILNNPWLQRYYIAQKADSYLKYYPGMIFKVYNITNAGYMPNELSL